MTELEKIAYAKSFIDKLANGINPLDDTLIPDGDVANNVRLSRCFFYVSDILRQVIDNGGITSAPIPKNKKISKKPFVLSLEQIEKFEFSQTPISATVLAKKINRLTEDETMERISYRHINQWLLNIGMLEYKEVGQGKKKRHPTADGEAMGIVLSFWGNPRGGSFPVVFYSEEAQRFILDNIEAVASTEVKKEKLLQTMDIDTEESYD